MKNNLKLLALALLLCFGCSEDKKEEIAPITPTPDPQPDTLDSNPTSPLPNELLGNKKFNNTLKDIWAFQSPSMEKEYILIGYYDVENTDGIYIVDPTNVKQPEIVGTVPGVGGFDIKTYGNYAYSVFGSDKYPGYVIDLKDPENPEIVNEFTGSHNIYTTESGLLISNTPGLKIYDIQTDPTSPTLLWYDSLQGGHETHVNGNFLYDFHGYAGTIIYDITDPSNPDSISTIINPDVTYHHSGWTNADQTILVLCDELAFQQDPTGQDFYIYDISDKTNPILLSSIGDDTSILHNVHIVGDYAYFSYYTAGYKVYDISNPENPVIEFEYDTSPTETGEYFSGAWGIYGLSNSGNKYISDMDNGLFIFNGPEE
ncbi:choice-of-anchor B family protein [Mangrovivirga sp. M17]|uniref:Choice-of-anchor B family protein n=1 Tax=Mangrovivirga halotolerans TaxID=2993936 RepID=A0ABT3RP70_9BACT|nr:choice-of-anchor B family protein [Mangrovivirga halotolerans]MCX2743271.1 choice-of-anchor B family protein [Mangrovivirga halotolerans]